MFNKKNKIIYIIIIIIIIFILIYQFINKKNDFIYSNFDSNSNSDKDNIETEKTTEERKELNINKIKVYITGEINMPGIYELEENSRICDVIERAGGIKEEANIDDINLAEIIEDGIKIDIPRKFEEKEDKNINCYNTKETNDLESNKKSETITSKENSEKININTATQTELESLPGIGPSTACKIIEYRKEKGKFKSAEDIKKVVGIGTAKYEKIKNLIKT